MPFIYSQKLLQEDCCLPACVAGSPDACWSIRVEVGGGGSNMRGEEAKMGGEKNGGREVVEGGGTGDDCYPDRR